MRSWAPLFLTPPPPLHSTTPYPLSFFSILPDRSFSSQVNQSLAHQPSGTRNVGRPNPNHPPATEQTFEHSAHLRPDIELTSSTPTGIDHSEICRSKISSTEQDWTIL